jgi:hypothetical protein
LRFGEPFLRPRCSRRVHYSDDHVMGEVYYLWRLRHETIPRRFGFSRPYRGERFMAHRTITTRTAGRDCFLFLAKRDLDQMRLLNSHCSRAKVDVKHGQSSKPGVRAPLQYVVIQSWARQPS